MSKLEFTEARRYMVRITDLGFKVEIRPNKKSDNTENTKAETRNESALSDTNSNLLLGQNRAKFKAPTDLPKEVRKPLKETIEPAGSSLGDITEVDASNELALVEDQTEGDFSKYNWSKDLDDDEVVKCNDNLVIKKGR